jgi:hypothetical protein
VKDFWIFDVRSAIATTSSVVRLALVALVVFVFPALGAYRLISANPLVQTITDIPLQGYNLADPGSSNRTARRAAVFSDGESIRSSFTLPAQSFAPDASTDDTLIFPVEGVTSINSYDLVRVRRTGEILRVIVAIDDVVTVVRGWAGTTPQALHIDDHVDIISLNTSFLAWYYCEKESLGRSTIWELSARQYGQSTTAMTLERSASGWMLSSKISGAPGPSIPLTFDPRGKWLFISLAHRNTEFATDEVYLTVRDPDSGAIVSSVTNNFSASFSPSLIPDCATIGDRYTVMWGEHRSAPGICIPAITLDCIADGRIGTKSLHELVSGQGLSGHITLHRYEACVWATNFSAGALGGSDNDARAGIIDGALHTFDSGSLIYPRRHQADPGKTMRGGLVSVDPYSFGSAQARIARPSFDSRIDTVIASPASEQTFAQLGGLNPRGVVGPKTRRFANAVINGQLPDRIRVAVFGNSRAVYPQTYPLRLSDGRFPGRALATNFVDMGLLGQAPLFDGGLIVGHIGPVPWCGWSAPDAHTGAYGVDCESELPLCRSLESGNVVLPSVAMISLVDSTLGSRFGIFSPTASRVPATGYPGPVELGSSDHYRGNHASVRLKPLYSARFMVRPEAGLPHTDPLRVTIYLQNHPSSSTVTVRGVRSLSQGSHEIWSAPVNSPPLGATTRSVQKTISNAVDAVILTAVNPLTRGYIELDDSDGGFHAIQIGDMVQIADAQGVYSTRDEAFSVIELERLSSGILRLFYEWTLKRPPAIGDRVSFIKSVDILQKVSIELPPCSQGQWRGIEIAAGNEGDGVMLWGFGFENPVRNGIVTMPIGRSGCGASVQLSRLPSATPPLGRSLLGRVFDELSPDVIVLATADQGTAGGTHVQTYENLLDLIRLEAPRAEPVLYSTGPEYLFEDFPDKSDAGGKFSIYVAMQLAAARKGAPITSFFCDPDYSSSAFARIQSGVDVTEGATHPSTILDMNILARQLLGLPATPPVISPNVVLACPATQVDFSVPQSPEPGVAYRWEIEDAAHSSGFAPLSDGVLFRGGLKVAEFRGTNTNRLTVTDFRLWNLQNWQVPGEGQVRCVESRAAESAVSAPASLKVCVTDLDCSGGVDGDDVILFFAAWDLGDPAADLTGDGGVDGDDVIDFFARWDAGC